MKASYGGDPERAADSTVGLAHLRGTRTFMGIELIVAASALVPREETELLGWTVVRLLGAMEGERRPLRIIDMCCGSGNLACGIAMAVPGVSVWASDLTDGCVSLTHRNVETLGLGERVRVFQGDLFASLAGLGLEGAIDVVVCNPPYISSARLDERSDLAREPREAFDGGPYGLGIHQRVAKDAVSFLRAGGWLSVEFGLGQARQLRLLVDRVRAYEGFETIENEAGEPRVALARKRETS